MKPNSGHKRSHHNKSLMFFVVPFSWPSLKLSYRHVPHGKNRFMVLLNLRLVSNMEMTNGDVDLWCLYF